MRGATCCGTDKVYADDTFQSTLLMRGATREDPFGVYVDPISIHAPHARSDLPSSCTRTRVGKISIHAPHARSDLEGNGPLSARAFQSTLLMRGATCRPHALQILISIFQSTLLMRGATHCKYNDAQTCTQFQSTLLMRGATFCRMGRTTPPDRFQSTLLMRGATRCRGRAQAGADFNPRSSCEERRRAAVHLAEMTGFQSTLLMRGAT